MHTLHNIGIIFCSKRSMAVCFPKHIHILSLSPALHFPLLTIFLSEERSHSLPPFIILITMLPFTRQTSSLLAQAQEGRLEGTMKEICHLFPPVFCCCFHGCRGKTKCSWEEEERKRETVCTSERKHCVLFTL